MRALRRFSSPARLLTDVLVGDDARRTLMWEPLPLIVYGYAKYPLSPSRRDTRVSSRSRLSTVTETSSTDERTNSDVVSLEVGDEVYAFEKYTPRGKEVDGVWYRGCVTTF